MYNKLVEYLLEGKFCYGDCIPESVALFKQLKQQGKDPRVVEGWVEVDNYDLLPNKEFLKKYFPDEYRSLSDPNFDDYHRVQQHTWVELDNKILDPTKSQFDQFGGVIKYYSKIKYTV